MLWDRSYTFVQWTIELLRRSPSCSYNTRHHLSKVIWRSSEGMNSEVWLFYTRVFCGLFFHIADCCGIFNYYSEKGKMLIFLLMYNLSVRTSMSFDFMITTDVRWLHADCQMTSLPWSNITVPHTANRVLIFT